MFLISLYLETTIVQDTMSSLLDVDIGLIHAVEYHNDLFSWKNYSNYTLILILHDLLQAVLEKLWICLHKQYSHLVGRYPCYVTSQMSREHTWSCFLHCCWVSTAAFFGSSLDRGLACLNCHPFTHFFLASPLKSWIWANPRYSVGNNYIYLFSLCIRTIFTKCI